jgi:hypothetical protein
VSYHVHVNKLYMIASLIAFVMFSRPLDFGTFSSILVFLMKWVFLMLFNVIGYCMLCCYDDVYNIIDEA